MIRISRVVTYAELHGNMQRYGIKSLYGNMSSLAKTAVQAAECVQPLLNLSNEQLLMANSERLREVVDAVAQMGRLPRREAIRGCKSG